MCLKIETFGKQLLTTQDLDPVYVALNNTDWSLDMLERWLVAYWTFYSCGFACWAAEQDRFWVAMRTAALNTSPSPLGARWPRGRERRHMRGKVAVATVDHLAAVPNMVPGMISRAPDYQLVARYVCGHVGFGPWIAFKAADMLERVVKVPVDFTQAAVFMFKDPVKAAIMFHNQRNRLPLLHPTPAQVAVPPTCEYLIDYFSGYLAPPLRDRAVGLQEVETILCKWKSHVNGRYPVGLDTREIRHEVRAWATVSGCAAEFLEGLPQ